jgi:uncharacterized membrane protein affecting hemolysin expression
MKNIVWNILITIAIITLIIVSIVCANPQKAQSYERDYQLEQVNQLEEVNSNLKEMIGLLERLNDCCRSCNK